MFTTDDFGQVRHNDPAAAFRERLLFATAAFKGDDPDTMIRRLEALEDFVINGANEVND